MGNKGDLRDFQWGKAVAARPAGLSISETADVLGFLQTTSRVYRGWVEKIKYTMNRRSVVKTPHCCRMSERSSTLLNLCHDQLSSFEGSEVSSTQYTLVSVCIMVNT